MARERKQFFRLNNIFSFSDSAFSGWGKGCFSAMTLIHWFRASLRILHKKLIKQSINDEEMSLHRESQRRRDNTFSLCSSVNLSVALCNRQGQVLKSRMLSFLAKTKCICYSPACLSTRLLVHLFTYSLIYHCQE